MRSVLVVLVEPSIEIGLSLVECLIDLLPERDPIALVAPRLVASLADAIGLRMRGLRPDVLDVLDCERACILMAIRGATVLGASVGEHASHRNLMLLQEGQHTSSEEFGSSQRRLPGIELGTADLPVGIEERRLVDAPAPPSGSQHRTYPGRHRTRAFALKFAVGLLIRRGLL